MTETKETLMFVAAAIVSLGLAYATCPSIDEFDVESLVGKPLTKEFAPEIAKRLTIVKFDEATATLREFEVAEEGGLWSIPSKGGYPADAESQMAKAATGVMDREILQIASKDAAAHAEYGVIDPKSPTLEVGQTGVGVRVTLEGKDGEPLVDLIVGKEVKDSPDQHFVRRATQDVVYIVTIDTDTFSTQFNDWIEDDLLTISPWDIQTVHVKDYTAELMLVGFQAQVNWDRRSEMTLRYDDGDSAWIAEELKRFDEASREYVPFDLEADQELNEDKLSELKNGLDDLSIVDVESKPSGLSASLKAGENFLKDNESAANLARKGFAPISRSDGEYEILSSEGEVVCTLKDGVEYILRFGNLQLTTSESVTANSSGDDPSEIDDAVNRYLFVMARFNESAVERPELEEVPELPEGETEESEAKDAPKGEGQEEKTGGDVDDQEADAPSELEGLLAERKQIEQRNQRSLDEYAEKLEAGRKKVEELNARFGDWYYVIANDVYNKIHLSREDIITKKKEEEDADEDDVDGEDASAFGVPGAAVPGLPDLSSLGGIKSAGEDSAEASEVPEQDAEPVERNDAAEESNAGDQDPGAEPVE